MNKYKERTKRYKAKNKYKTVAQNRALYVHKEQKPCSVHGCLNKSERHHDDYSKPEDIIWLCREHHNKIHGKVRGVCIMCDKPHHAKGLCHTHHMAWLRNKWGHN